MSSSIGDISGRSRSCFNHLHITMLFLYMILIPPTLGFLVLGGDDTISLPTLRPLMEPNDLCATIMAKILSLERDIIFKKEGQIEVLKAQLQGIDVDLNKLFDKITILKTEMSQANRFRWACVVRSIIEELEQLHSGGVNPSNEEAKGSSPKERSRLQRQKVWEWILDNKGKEFQIRDILDYNNKTKLFESNKDLAKGISYAYMYLSDKIHAYAANNYINIDDNVPLIEDREASKAIKVLTFNKEFPYIPQAAQA
ncbi:unnamed protein product [Bemisia tabaci]|uniref:Uncharacterized protein n=1 Tax=Bemisia tabaci TaxID=7038 RepID=A0A9P0AGM7_BEMTA|nr:unnamed protein product [Bemisia tabaci]